MVLITVALEKQEQKALVQLQILILLNINILQVKKMMVQEVRIKHIHVMNDPTLEAMRVDLLKLVTDTDVEALRDSSAYRQEIKTVAETIKDKFNF